MGDKNFYPITSTKQRLWLLLVFGLTQSVSASPYQVVRPTTLADQPLAQTTTPVLATQDDIPSNQNTLDTNLLSTQKPLADQLGVNTSKPTHIPLQATADDLINVVADSTTPNQATPSRTTQNFDNLSLDSNQIWQKLGRFYRPNPDQCTGTWQLPDTFLHNSSAQNDTINAQADYGYYNDLGARLVGRAVLQKNQNALWANTIDFDLKTQETQAKQAVSFASTQGDDTLVGGASALSLNIKTGNMSANNAAFASTKLDAHGYANKLTRLANHHYELTQGIFSTCPPDQRLWHLGAQKIEIDTQKGRAIAKNATLNIKGVPVFYLPYFDFPINKHRATGFLLPKATFGSQSKIQLSTPYYLNLAPNYDATVTPTFFADKNPMLSLQLRHLGRFGLGELDGAALLNDRMYQHKTRHHLFFDYNWQPTEFTHLYATYRNVSDAHYLSDFNNLSQPSSFNLPRRAGIRHQHGNFLGDLRFESHQRLLGENRLGEPILDKDRPYQKLPALSLSYQKAWGGLLWSFQNNSTYFKKSIKDGSMPETSGLRMHSHLSANHRKTLPWGAFSSKVGLTGLYTAYDKDSLDSQNLSPQEASKALLVPSLRLDASLFFAKHSSQGSSFLTPKVAYFYTPYQNQDDMPNFDSILADRSYRQLFMDSVIVGHDRIADQNALSTALEYQYFDTTGNQKLWAAVGKQWQFAPARVRLGDHRPLTDTGILWQLSAQASPNLWFEASGATPTPTLPHNIQGSIRYQPYQNLFVRAGLSQQQNSYTGTRLSAYEASFALPIGRHWQVLGHTQYDKNFHDFVDSLFGIHYNDCCMGFAVYGRSHRNELVPSQKTHSIMAELKLKGLGSESRLSTLLKERMVGYEPLFSY